MTARYIIRLDDACPTMDSERWLRLENILDRLQIRPIVAVVPDNLDPLLQVGLPDPNFWSRVHSWKNKGWTIAMHGFQHAFHSIEKNKLILPFYNRSEFAGLSLIEQSQKILSSWNIFLKNGITPNAWIAPGHCFDYTTLQALQNETSIRIISDGIACNAYFENGFYWIPQQLWVLSPKRFGLWTLCLHPNSMSLDEIDQLGEQLALPYFKTRIVSVDSLKQTYRKRDIVDYLYAMFFWNRDRSYKILKKIRLLIVLPIKNRCR